MTPLSASVFQWPDPNTSHVEQLDVDGVSSANYARKLFPYPTPSIHKKRHMVSDSETS